MSLSFIKTANFGPYKADKSIDRKLYFINNFDVTIFYAGRTKRQIRNEINC